jgi:hypothetical protein
MSEAWPGSDKSRAKRNPEKWGDDSGLNVVCIRPVATSYKHRSTMLDPAVNGSD